ncbi:hypothetical protein [Streptomyces sp. NPDC001500]
MRERTHRQSMGDDGAAVHLLLDPEFLLRADPARVISLLDRADRADSADVRLAARVYRQSASVHATSGISACVRGRLLALDAARHGAHGLSARLSAACPCASRVTVHWADGRLVGFASTVSGCFEPDVLGLGMSTIHGTEALIVFEDDPVVDPPGVSALRVREVMTGRQLTDDPLPGGKAPLRLERLVTAATATTVHGRPVALVSSGDGSLLCCDPSQPPMELVTRPGRVITALAAVNIDGIPYAAAGTPDRTVRLWDLQRHHCARSFQAGSGAELVAVAAVEDAGRLLAVVADDDGHVTAWNVSGASPFGRGHRIAQDRMATTALAAGRLGDRPVAAVGCSVTSPPAQGPRSAHGVVRIVDLTDGKQWGEDLLFPARVTALCMSRDGRLAVGFGPEVAVMTLG